MPGAHIRRAAPHAMPASAGETALSLAAGAGHVSCMQALLGAGASASLSQDNAPRPMHRAASSGGLQTVLPFSCCMFLLHIAVLPAYLPVIMEKLCWQAACHAWSCSWSMAPV